MRVGVFILKRGVLRRLGVDRDEIEILRSGVRVGRGFRERSKIGRGGERAG